MRRLLLGSMTALGIVVAPLALHAQESPTPPADAATAGDYTMTPEQQAAFDAWTPEE